MMDARAKTRVIGVIKGRLAEIGMPATELSAMAHISSATFTRRMKNPETLTLGEIWRLEDALHLERGTIGGVK